MSEGNGTVRKALISTGLSLAVAVPAWIFGQLIEKLREHDKAIRAVELHIAEYKSESVQRIQALRDRVMLLEQKTVTRLNTSSPILRTDKRGKR